MEWKFPRVSAWALATTWVELRAMTMDQGEDNKWSSSSSVCSLFIGQVTVQLLSMEDDAAAGHGLKGRSLGKDGGLSVGGKLWVTRPAHLSCLSFYYGQTRLNWYQLSELTRQIGQPLYIQSSTTSFLTYPFGLLAGQHPSAQLKF